MTEQKSNVVLIVGGAIAMLAALLMCGGAMLLLVLNPIESAPESQSDPPTSEPTSDRSCTLRIPGKPSLRVPVFREESDYDDWSEAAARDDTHGQTDAIRRSGMLVESGTRCKRLEGFASVKVRILGGPFEGRAGWTPREWAE